MGIVNQHKDNKNIGLGTTIPVKDHNGSMQTFKLDEYVKCLNYRSQYYDKIGKITRVFERFNYNSGKNTCYLEVYFSGHTKYAHLAASSCVKTNNQTTESNQLATPVVKPQVWKSIDGVESEFKVGTRVMLTDPKIGTNNLKYYNVEATVSHNYNDGGVLIKTSPQDPNHPGGYEFKTYQLRLLDAPVPCNTTQCCQAQNPCGALYVNGIFNVTVWSTKLNSDKKKEVDKILVPTKQVVAENANQAFAKERDALIRADTALDSSKIEGNVTAVLCTNCS